MQGIPPELPLLVLPSSTLDFPLCPLEVANTDGSTVAVFTVFVYAVVGNVTVFGELESLSVASDKNTSANPGAGTLIAHVLAVWSQATV